MSAHTHVADASAIVVVAIKQITADESHPDIDLFQLPLTAANGR